MLLLTDTNDKLQLVTSSVSNIDVVACGMDHTTATDNVVGWKQATTIASAGATTDIVAAPASGDIRNVKTLHIRNRHASTPCDVTVVLDDNGTDYELHKVTLRAGEMLEYVEGLGFFLVGTATKLDAKLRVSSDVVNATTSFADVTGLTCPVESGKHYNFEAHFYHFANATTSGPRFAIGGVAMTAMRIGAIITESGGVAAAVMNGNAGDVTAVDTAVAATTDSTTTMVLSIMSGWFQPSANGTFAFRQASEIAVAAGLTIKTGSWARVWEADN